MSESTWVAVRALMEMRKEVFVDLLRERFEREYGRAVELHVYLDPDAVIVVADEDVYINTEEDPFLFVGDTKLLDMQHECRKLTDR